MPSNSRRREFDIRAGRFESEIRDSEMANGLVKGAGLYACSKCRRPFEEKSRVCPRCETKTMCQVKPIPERHLEEARRNAIKEALRTVRGL